MVPHFGAPRMKKLGRRATGADASRGRPRVTFAAMQATPAPAPAAPAAGARKPVWALVLGIVALVTGFTAITLLCGVIAITLASLTFQDNAAGRGDPGRRGLAVGGMVCGIAALCLWIPVVVVIAIAES